MYEMRSHWRAVSGWIWLGFNRTIPADFLEVREELAGVDFPQEIRVLKEGCLGSLAWFSGCPPRSDTWRLCQHSSVCECSNPFKAGLLHDGCSKNSWKEKVWLQPTQCLLSSHTLQEQLLYFGLCYPSLVINLMPEDQRLTLMTGSGRL